MIIRKVQVHNYKRFADSGPIEFAAGINVIVGENDAGKTALVEAISLHIENVPHRSLTTIPERGFKPTPASKVRVVSQLTDADLRRAIAPHANFTVRFHDGAHLAAFRAVNRLMDDGMILEFQYAQSFTADDIPGIPSEPPHQFLLVSNSATPTGVQLKNESVHGGNPSSLLGPILAAFVRSSIYTFRAERLRLSKGGMGAITELQPDAANLPQVLNHLQTSNPSRWTRLVNHIHYVFPHITQVTCKPVSHAEALIEIWDIPPDSERSDLAISLEHSGTGIGQALAMLYVVVNSDAPRVIVIDEPHSFLHPGAVRRLFAIFAQYPQHQYIVTTHSPAAIAAASPVTINLVKRAPAGSTVRAVSTARRGDLIEFLDEVGAKLSDVFGPDRILWVEGKTEEHCFPHVLEKYAPQTLVGMDVLAVHDTGDLTKRHAKRLLAVYSRLTSGVTLLPPAVAFVFDREFRSQNELQEIADAGKGLVRFLPRRMYENYLLDAAAIHAVLSADDTEAQPPLTVEAVAKWLADNGADDDKTNAAQLLDRLFSELSGTRVSYDKVRHGTALTKYLLASDSPVLASLANDFLVPLL